MTKSISFFFLIIFSIGFFFGCAPKSKEQPPLSLGTVEPVKINPTQPVQVAADPPEIQYLIPPIDFAAHPDFCGEEPIDSPFLLSCSESGLFIEASPNRRKVDSMLRREITISTNAFSLPADVTSQPTQKEKLDQNQFGFYATTENGNAYAVRVEGQYINFEEWISSEYGEKVVAYNTSFAPALYSAGRSNRLQLICNAQGCDFFGNNVLIGRSPFRTIEHIKAIGYFTASNWDQEFGSVLLESFSIQESSSNESQPFFINDALTEDSGTFSQMGLSGAFSDFEQDGFHFSPVIPYGYYGAKTGPSLADVSVRASVTMDFVPNKKATQYAGVVCRSSMDGMYAAVLRADGNYIIYRDHIRRPFAWLAKHQIEGIQAGRSEHDIRLDCIGSTISLYINDQLVESFTDDRYGIRNGRAGIFTKAGGAPNSNAIIFRDFSIKEIRQ